MQLQKTKIKKLQLQHVVKKTKRLVRLIRRLVVRQIRKLAVRQIKKRQLQLLRISKRNDLFNENKQKMTRISGHFLFIYSTNQELFFNGSWFLICIFSRGFLSSNRFSEIPRKVVIH